MTTSEAPNDSVRTRLLQAAQTCFLSDDYHQVSTRQIAERANANVSMIRYYFGSKEGLYEEMIRETLAPLLNVLDGSMLNSADGFTDYLRLYYETMAAKPEFPKLILKVLALNPGAWPALHSPIAGTWAHQGGLPVSALKAEGQIPPDVDPDILRMAFVSLP